MSDCRGRGPKRLNMIHPICSTALQHIILQCAATTLVLEGNAPHSGDTAGSSAKSWVSIPSTAGFARSSFRKLRAASACCRAADHCLASNLIPAIFKLHVAAIKRTESWSLRLGSRQKLKSVLLKDIHGGSIDNAHECSLDKRLSVATARFIPQRRVFVCAVPAEEVQGVLHKESRATLTRNQ